VDFGASHFVLDNIHIPEVDNPVWLAPEIINKQPFNEKVDTYAYGVILWEIFCRDRYFSEYTFMYDLIEQVKAGNRPSIPPECPPLYKQVISCCWDQEPNKRAAWEWVLSKLMEMLSIEQLNHQLESFEEDQLKRISNTFKQTIKEKTSDKDDLLFKDELVLQQQGKLCLDIPEDLPETDLNKSFLWEQLFNESDTTVYEEFEKYLGTNSTNLHFYFKALQIKSLPQEVETEALKKICNTYFTPTGTLLATELTMYEDDPSSISNFDKIFEDVKTFLTQKWMNWQGDDGSENSKSGKNKEKLKKKKSLSRPISKKRL